MLMKIIGLVRFVRDVELSQTASGMSVAKGTFVSSEKYKDQESSLFQDFVCFGKQAEVLSQYSGKKGQQIYVTGKLKTESWEAKDGTKKSKNVMTLESFDFVSSANQSQSQPQPQRPAQDYKQAPQFNANNFDDDIPF
ncbi:single-stranded DNA-binding protein [Francisella marina]|uniref:single-stranded DNA-binding protein n=1 Tax=Francisella marina TaxID=2249302 RepID=UPI0011ED99E4|nr:single-stranded DNA-binding protein [Francisella marina]QEO58306.1 single-stranded DNA-binding protein [Francisella marina]